MASAGPREPSPLHLRSHALIIFYPPPFLFPSTRYKGSKRDHLAAIKRKSGYGFEHMIFFDDDPTNIRDVSSLGVLSVLTPHGVTRKVFEEGLAVFAARAQSSDSGV